VFAQSREVTEAELTKLKTDATEKGKGLPVRIKISTTGYEPSVSSESHREFGPNDTYHYLSIRKANGVETRTEGIRIGSVRYMRQQDGSWIKEPPPNTVGGSGSGSGSGSGVGSSTPPETATEYLYLGGAKIDGQETNHYRRIRTIKFTSRTPVLTRRVVDEYWFRTDGLMVKETHEDAFENSKQRYKSVTEYEYGKDIKITAPIPD
jgi:hypothetical protein